MSGAGRREPEGEGLESEGRESEGRESEGRADDGATNTAHPDGSSGGVAIGTLSGGAVAAGRGASAEYRTEPRAEYRTDPVDEAPPGGRADADPPSVPPPAPGGISIGTMSGGAVVAGSEGRATAVSTRTPEGAEPGPVDGSPELRAAIAELRARLRELLPADDAPRTSAPPPGVPSDEELAELDAGLAEAEDEIDATGQVRPDRLHRLRDRLELGATAAAGLASTAALAQQIAQLLGGQG